MLDRLQQIREIYQQLPSLECRGKCWNSCGPIDMSITERERIVELGYEIPVFTPERARRWAMNEPLHCPALTIWKTCAVYKDRPLICRLWGMSESMPCPHGCRPNRMLDDEEALGLILQVMRIGGHDHLGYADNQEMLDVMHDPELGPLMAAFMRGERQHEAEIVRLIAERRRR